MESFQYVYSFGCAFKCRGMGVAAGEGAGKLVLETQSREVVRSKNGDTTVDVSVKLRAGLLDLGWVVVCLGTMGVESH